MAQRRSEPELDEEPDVRVLTVTDNPKLAEDQKDSTLPAGASAFDSGDIRADQVYSRTFTVPGTYPYFCRRHEDDGMVGSVVVAPPP